MRLSLPPWLLSLPLRVKVLTAVGIACLVALLIGVLGLVQLGNLQQRSEDIKTNALVPSNQIAEVRRAFLQTRIDALADELVPSKDAQATAHEALPRRHHGHERGRRRLRGQRADRRPGEGRRGAQRQAGRSTSRWSAVTSTGSP